MQGLESLILLWERKWRAFSPNFQIGVGGQVFEMQTGRRKRPASMMAEHQGKEAHLRHSTAPGYDTCPMQDSLRELFITGKGTVKGWQSLEIILSLIQITSSSLSASEYVLRRSCQCRVAFLPLSLLRPF